MVRHQRARIMRAIGQEVAARGYDATTVEIIREEAGVSRRTFYDHFTDKEDAVVSFHGAVTAGLLAVVDAALDDAGDGSPGSAGRAMRAVLELASRRPETTLLWLIAPGRANPRLIEARSAARATVEQRLGDWVVAAGHPKPDRVGVTVGVGGVCELVRQRLAGGDREGLPLIAPDLTYTLLVAHVGHDAATRARREARR